MDIPKQTIKALEQVFAQKPNVLAVYFYGSRVKGNARSKSDLDIAIVVDGKEHVSYEQLYYEVTQRVLHSDIDLRIVTEKSSPTFLFQILRDGTRIYERNARQRVRFEAKVLVDFYDTQHIRTIYDHYLKAAFSS